MCTGTVKLEPGLQNYTPEQSGSTRGEVEKLAMDVKIEQREKDTKMKELKTMIENLGIETRLARLEKCQEDMEDQRQKKLDELGQYLSAYPVEPRDYNLLFSNCINCRSSAKIMALPTFIVIIPFVLRSIFFPLWLSSDPQYRAAYL